MYVRRRIIKKIITFRLGNYLSMWVTFDVFTCNGMIKLKIASKRSELHCNWVRWLIWKLEHLVNTPQLAILMIKVCWGNWNVSSHAGTIHMTRTVICFEITLEKCICVSKSILSTVPPSNKNQWFSGNWPFFAMTHRVWWLWCIPLSFQTFNFALIVTVYYIYFSKVEVGESITWLPLFGIVWLYNFAE